MKKNKTILFLIFLTYPLFSYSHINHYDKLKMIEMDVLRNGKKIGYNNYTFENRDDLLIVKNETKFNAKLIGISLLDVNGFSTETYKKGKLIEFKSSTIQNKKKKFNVLTFNEVRKAFEIKGSSFNGFAPSTAVLGNWWNHNIFQSKIIISPLSGSLKFQEVNFLSKEKLYINKNIYHTSRFKIELKKNVNDKEKEEFNVWLEDKSNIILKVTYSKFGDWEYIVKKIEKFN